MYKKKLFEYCLRPYRSLFDVMYLSFPIPLPEVIPKLPSSYWVDSMLLWFYPFGVHANVLYIEFSVQLRVLLWPAISAKTATFAILNVLS